jgi:hypothetical protein
MSRMKLFCWAPVLVFLCSSAFASGISFANTGGTLSTAGGGLQLTGSTLTLVSGLGAPYDGDVASHTTSFSFSIGTPSTGSTASGDASWTSGGGSLSFKDSTTGLDFSGAFTCSSSQPCSWSGTSSSSATFVASFSGTLNGKSVNGLTAQISLDGLNIGSSAVTVVPETSTLGLVGMGLLAMAGLTRRRGWRGLRSHSEK